MNPRLLTFYAWVVVDRDGNEDLMAIEDGDNFIPCVSTDKENVERMRELILDVKKENNLELKLLRFTTREVIEELPRA